MSQKIIKRRSDEVTNLSVAERRDPQALVKALLRARGEKDEGLDYGLKHLHSPKLMKGIDDGVELLVQALKGQQRILIVGDFDADGATSTAVAIRGLKALGAYQVDYLVPNRFEYGYGLTPEIVALACENKPDLLITVDNGISSIDGVAAAQAQGIKVLVTDHHLPGKSLPDAEAIVNPNQPGCEFPSKNLAGVGVIFYLMLALRAKLREINWFTERSIAEPNLAIFLDLVALGTVADVVPLDYNNRILVAQGLERIKAGAACPGILALLKVASREHTKVSAADFGFAIGPRLNAAGRLDDMSIGIRCLLSDDWLQSLEVAAELDSLNKERRAIESSMQADALKDLEQLAEDGAGQNGVSLYREDWHQGVVGIVASRIKDRLHRPVIAFADADELEVKGSGRSISGLHLRDVLDEVATSNPGLVSKFGGHAMAAGISLPKERLEEFSRAFDLVCERNLTDELKEPVLWSDGPLSSEQLSLVHAEALKSAGPWGQAFPEPVFDGRFRLLEQRIVGAKHLKMLLADEAHDGLVLDAIAFGVDLELWPNPDVQSLRLVYKLDVNEFRGRRSVQLLVDDLQAI
ncbi:single-stranded-DNA-specific exonuclease RecJ [Agaribacterium haliotis]|uniref:single-stranded-DNA-specific exonuclease RecJ n=1 Tax=Agaribacterium haliotis TaxID=2013869 RepID=UPI000BB57B49|nr:single-stranded-DNA-specific exonuclease RecJ [Agaribacterium haliotis]